MLRIKHMNTYTMTTMTALRQAVQIHCYLVMRLLLLDQFDDVPAVKICTRPSASSFQIRVSIAARHRIAEEM